MDGKLKFLRYFAYALEIVILYVLSGIPGFLPSLFGSKPIILLAVALTVAVFENEVPAMAVGLACGILIDVGADSRMGYYTIALTILCFMLGYCQRNFFVTNFINASIIGVFSVLGLLLLHFLLFCVFQGAEDLGQLFLKQYLVRFVYTVLFLLPLFWFNRLFRSSMKSY